jgi:hypothetical protein
LILLEIFYKNILPVFLIAGLGYLLGQRLQMKPRLLSQVTLNLFTPSLTFVLLTKNQLDGIEVLTMFAFACGIMLVIGSLTFGIGKLMKLEHSVLAAVLLCAIFMNAGNFGLPLLEFAFGEKAQAYGSLYFVSMITLNSTLGIAIASSGKMHIRQAVLNLFRYPALYAAVLAVLFVTFKWPLPVPVERSVEILGNAAVPCMLVLLGMQLQTARWNGHYRALGLALTARMLAAPLLAIAVSIFFGFQGDFYRAAVLESSMPPAVMNTVVASEFDTEPSFVAFVVLVGTVLSPVVLTPLLAYLGA